jgi:hypothetical protein
LADTVYDALEVACYFPIAVELFADQAAFNRRVMNPAIRGQVIPPVY